MGSRCQLTFATIGILAVLPSITSAQSVPRRDAKGQFRLKFEEHSALTEITEIYRRFYPGKEPTAEQKKNAEFDLKQFSLDVLVPSSYKPDGTWGLFVWLGFVDPPAAWIGVLTRHKLILVESRCGKSKIDSIPVRLPIDYVHNLKKLYTLDESRIYVGGFSGGASIAQWCQSKFPEVFSGAMFVAGGSLIPVTMLDGEFVPTVKWANPWYGRSVEDAKKSVPLVVLTNTDDHADLFHALYDGFVLEGYVRATFIEAPSKGHRPPEVKSFEKAVKALDQSEEKAAPTTAPTTSPAEPNQLAQARRLFATAQWVQDMADVRGAPPEPARERAAVYWRQVIAEYPTTPYAERAKAELAKLKPTASTKPAK